MRLKPISCLLVCNVGLMLALGVIMRAYSAWRWRFLYPTPLIDIFRTQIDPIFLRRR